VAHRGITVVLCCADSVNVLDFNDRHMFGSWAVDPLKAAYSTPKFAGCQMAATLLSTDQVGISKP